MPNELTHASFFSGVGGLDLGLERAGWRTVSFSEIDPYACAVLAQRWPGVRNLGSITAPELHRPVADGSLAFDRGSDDWTRAFLWSGGFPCQDLSVAGKRRGFGLPRFDRTASGRGGADYRDDRQPQRSEGDHLPRGDAGTAAGTRSGLAFAFLELVAVHRPRAVLLENVPGLLSSHGGRDMAALIGALVELGYGVGYRVLDARHFGVPQRRRRVFILGITPGGRAGAERAAEVLSVGSRCRRHPPTGIEAGPRVAEGVALGVDIARAVTGTSGKRHDDDTDTLIANGLRASDGHHGYSSPRGDGGDNLVSAPIRGNPYGDHISAESHLIRQASDPDGMRTPDGLAGRAHDRGGVADTLRVGGRASGAGDSYDNTPWVAETLNSGGNSGGFRTEPGAHLVTHYRKSTRAHNADDWESWEADDQTDTLDASGHQARTAAAVIGGQPAPSGGLPLGLDSHRYRCCGNGVVSDVAEWIGLRLAAYLAESVA